MNAGVAVLVAVLAFAGTGAAAHAQSDGARLGLLETDLGEIVIEFFPADAPNHVDNFVGLAESGFYDGVLFHRIIPGFMIQGGDPNTINGDPSTWGTGGPDTSVDAEFNTIKHNRGIVSMARSASPDSGGSQFFIVHADSNFLDGQYTVFGRIATEESYKTLDRIAGVPTGSGDRPLNPDEVRIMRASTIDRSEAPDLLDQGEPERISAGEVSELPRGSQSYENEKHEVTFSIPVGWIIQEPEKITPDSPDLIAIGPSAGLITPYISLTVQNTTAPSFDAAISEKNERLAELAENNTFEIVSQEKTSRNNNQVYITTAEGKIAPDSETYEVMFREVMIYGKAKTYTLAYVNGIDDFGTFLEEFEKSVDSFEFPAEKTDSAPGTGGGSGTEDGGGCLIATAAFGSELAPQVQQLRELRDGTILQTGSGTAFLAAFNSFYYTFSPAIADMERESPAFREAVRIAITPMIASLSLLGHAEIDSEAQMLGYGIGIILLNAGMYLGAPAIVIFKLGRRTARRAPGAAA